MENIVGIAFVALAVTKVVDGVRNVVDRGDSLPKVVWNVAAFGLGIAAAFAFDALGLVIEGGADTLLATGLIIGATASGWHEALDAASGYAKRGTRA